MSYLRFQDEDESSVAGTVSSVLLGAVAGFAVGMLVAQRVGGFSGLTNLARRVRIGGSEPTDVAGGPAPADNSTAAAADAPTDVTGAPIHREDIDQLGTIIDGL